MVAPAVRVPKWRISGGCMHSLMHWPINAHVVRCELRKAHSEAHKKALPLIPDFVWKERSFNLQSLGAQG